MVPTKAAAGARTSLGACSRDARDSQLSSLTKDTLFLESERALSRTSLVGCSRGTDLGRSPSRIVTKSISEEVVAGSLVAPLSRLGVDDNSAVLSDALAADMLVGGIGSFTVTVSASSSLEVEDTLARSPFPLDSLVLGLLCRSLFELAGGSVWAAGGFLRPLKRVRSTSGRVSRYFLRSSALEAFSSSAPVVVDEGVDNGSATVSTSPSVVSSSVLPLSESASSVSLFAFLSWITLSSILGLSFRCNR
mmetsp:Transcript_15666/g.29490  ORF Transcript_15666/g.29490 Transcript_15666/m.29490 type:complete len:249 (-) Transcript_15666:162-908(-)